MISAKLKTVIPLMLASVSCSLFKLVPAEIVNESILPLLNILDLTRLKLSCKFLNDLPLCYIRETYYPGNKLSIGAFYEDYLNEPEDLIKFKILDEIDALKDTSSPFNEGLLNYIKTSLFASDPIRQLPYYDSKHLDLIKLLRRHKTFECTSKFILDFLRMNIKEVLPHIKKPVNHAFIKEYVVFSKQIDPEILDYLLTDHAEREIMKSSDINGLPIKPCKNPITIALLLRLADDTNYEKVIDILDKSNISNTVGAFLMQFINKKLNKNLVLGILHRFKFSHYRAGHLLLLCARYGYGKEAHLLLRGEENVSRHLEIIYSKTTEFEGSTESDQILETAIIYIEDEDDLLQIIKDHCQEDSMHHIALASYCGRSSSFILKMVEQSSVIYQVADDLTMIASIAPGLGMVRYHQLELSSNILSEIIKRGDPSPTGHQLKLSLGWNRFVSDSTMSCLLEHEVSFGGSKVTPKKLIFDADISKHPLTLKSLIDIHITHRTDLCITQLDPIMAENLKIYAARLVQGLDTEERAQLCKTRDGSMGADQDDTFTLSSLCP